MRRCMRWVVLAMAAVAAAGCASTMTVSSHMDRDVNFTRYRTFDWGPADALPTGDARLDKNPFFKDHVEGAVEKELAARGLTISSSGAPDLLIHYHANISQRIDVNRVDRGYGYCYGVECQSGVIEYEAGTLVLDLVDSRTNRVIWRGWAQDTIEGALDNEDEMARQIDEAVSRMLARLPPRL